MVIALAPPKVPLPTVALRVYHATLSGEKLEILKSFKRFGALPNLALGFGQGAGFYVFTKLDQVVNHAKGLSQDAFSKGVEVKGFPVFIVIDATINPIEWDVDYELNLSIMIQFLINNFNNLVKKVGDGDIEIGGHYIKFSDPSTRIVPPKVIFFAYSNIPGGERVSSGSINTGAAQNLPNAELIGRIFNRLQELFPKEIHAFEKSLFERLANERGLIMKYVGKRPLQIAGYYVYYNGKWVSNTDFERIPEMNALLQK